MGLMVKSGYLSVAFFFTLIWYLHVFYTWFLNILLVNITFIESFLMYVIVIVES